MGDKESTESDSGKKRRLDIDFNKLLVDDPPPDIIVLNSSACADGDDRSEEEERREKQGQSHCARVPEEILRLSDWELHHKILSVSANYNGFAKRLPDKGEKLRIYLKDLEYERERRKQFRPQEDATGCSRTSNSENSRHSRDRPSDESKQEAPVSSQSPPRSSFASSFMQKMENDNNSRICDAFSSELQSLGGGDRRKKRPLRQCASKGTEKCPLPLNGRGKTGLASNGKFQDRKISADTNSCSHSTTNSIRQSRHSKYSKAKETVVLLDDEDPEVEEFALQEDDAGLRETNIFYPSRNDPECVEVRYEELKCLAPGEYLTSTIMNFYIRYLQVPTSPANNIQNDYHFFNTYFYKKLQEAVSHQNSDREAFFVKFRRWWKGVNLFQKAYILLPIHEDQHWSLVIICIPDKADESGPIILHLDSLGYHCSRTIFDCVKRLLKEEWNYLKEEIDPPNVPMTERIWEHLPRRIEEKIISVPQQNNDSDCGPFVLFFIERFIFEAPQRLKKQNLAMFGKRWFKPEEASGLRSKIKKILMEEFHKSTSIIEPVMLSSNGSSSGTREHIDIS